MRTDDPSECNLLCVKAENDVVGFFKEIYLSFVPLYGYIDLLDRKCKQNNSVSSMRCYFVRKWVVFSVNINETEVEFPASGLKAHSVPVAKLVMNLTQRNCTLTLRYGQGQWF